MESLGMLFLLPARFAPGGPHVQHQCCVLEPPASLLSTSRDSSKTKCVLSGLLTLRSPMESQMKILILVAP